jgi:L-lactate dehydrogenase (cytochrome)
MMRRPLRGCLNVEDFAHRSRAILPRAIVDFFDGGAEDEQTIARNRSAFANWALIPRVLQDVSGVRASRHVMGQDLSWPFIVGPTGMPGLLHPDGEIGLASAAERVGAMYTLSTMATRSIEEVAAAVNGPLAFQLYLFRDRAITLELLQRAKAANYRALILTVDVQVPANRERDRRSGMIIPPRLAVKTVADFAFHPTWCWNVLVRKPITLANFSGRRADPGVPLLKFINEQFDPSISWRDLEWVAQQWGGPVAIKGVLSPADAKCAVEHGAQTIILSNHGGRQLDAAVSPMDVLPEVCELLDGRAELIVDGGVRRGTDMLKAIALGASACMSGRVGLYGLGAGGTQGATSALSALRAEFERDLALLGVNDVALVDRSYVNAVHHSRPTDQRKPR